MHEVITRLQKELKAHDKPENKFNIQQFFKEKLKTPYSLRGPVFRKISVACFSTISALPKPEILKICDEVLETDLMHAKGFAFDWARRLEKQLTPSDFPRFERWVRKYVSNWGECDSLCCGALGLLIRKHPELASRRAKWVRSKNRWIRRSSAVSLIPALRDGALLKEAFATADVLLLDDDDMVQKGYGWMLKDASLEFPEEVFAYVMKHKDGMPRTALRYAIERYSAAKRKQAMKKG